MAYRSQIEELARIRARRQRPEGYVVVGDTSYSRAWAARNSYFYVPAKEITDETEAFVGLFVLIRTHEPKRLMELAQRLSLVAKMVTVFDTNRRTVDFLVHAEAA